MGAENLVPTGTRSPYRAARNESLYRLSYSGPVTDLRIRFVSVVGNGNCERQDVFKWCEIHIASYNWLD